MARLNWKNAKTYKKSITSEDERAFRSGDEASRWLDAHDRPIKQKKNPKKRRLAREHYAEEKPSCVIYTDGACEPNPGIGGWAFVVYQDGREIHSECGGDSKTTNNIMEMTGLIMALRWLQGHGTSALIYSDSQYLVNGCNSWRFSWKGKGWKRGKPLIDIKNKELWIDLDGLLDASTVKISWCKGHAGIEGNEVADKLAGKGRKNVMPKK